jgi:uncharacterized protein YjbI with pentapeptide repeats
MLRRDYWLEPRNRSPELLLIILILSFTAFLLRDAQGIARVGVVAIIALLGVALALGCLVVFPNADIWKVSGQDQAYSQTVNDVRNVLISAVVAAFGLITLFLTYEAAEASRTSAEIAAQQATASRLSDAGSLMGHENRGIRLAGIQMLVRLIDDKEITDRNAFLILASYIRSESPWRGKASKTWKKMSDSARLEAASSPVVGRGSLVKRTDVQGALNLLASKSKTQLPDGNEKSDFRADLRDVNLQGAAFGTAYFENAIFNGTHLDYLDCGVKEGQAHANLSKADFRGASLYHAILRGVNLSGAWFQAPINEDGTPRPEQATDLSYADLQQADLTGTRFDGANLRGANLQGAVIHKTNFTHAVLTGANFKGTNLVDSVGLEITDLSGVISDSTTQWPGGVSVP